MLPEKATCIIFIFVHRPQFWTQLCTYIYIRILYRRPSRWPSDIETCWNIRDKTYIICADGILFLVITHLSQSVCSLLSNGPRCGRTSDWWRTLQTRHSGWATDTVFGVTTVTPALGTLIVAGPWSNPQYYDIVHTRHSSDQN